MLYGSQRFETTITNSHVGHLQAAVWFNASPGPECTITSGTVSSDSTRLARREASVQIIDTPTVREALSTPGAGLRIWRGASVGGGSPEYLPVHWGLVSRYSRDRTSGTLSVTSPDLGQRIVQDKFIAPERSSVNGATVVQNITALVRRSLPWVQIEDQSGEAFPCPSVTWEREPSEAIADLCASIGVETYLRPDGVWVIRKVRTLGTPPEVRVDYGRNLLSLAQEVDMLRIRNVVVAQAERSDGGTAAYAVSQDDDPTSPTWVGRMGRSVGFYTSSLLTSTYQARVAADAIRARMSGKKVELSYETIAHPGVDSGDRQDVFTDEREYHQVVVDSLSMDLLSGSMSLTARSAAEPEGLSS